MTQAHILGVDLGSTKISVSLWTSFGKKLKEQRFLTLEGGWQPNLSEIIQISKTYSQGQEIQCVGVSAGGPVDLTHGRLIDVPNSKGWQNAPIVKVLEEALTVPVKIENDANACTLAEWQFGAGKESNHLAFLTFSTGIGAGLILDGDLYRGARNLAGEIGHQIIVPDGAPCGCGKRGCLEAYASGQGIERQLNELREQDPTWPQTAKQLVEEAQSGSQRAVDLLKDVAHYLAQGIANLVFMLDIDRVILGTIAVGAGDLIFDPLKDRLQALLWPELYEGLSVVPAELGPELGDTSAFCVARIDN